MDEASRMSSFDIYEQEVFTNIEEKELKPCKSSHNDDCSQSSTNIYKDVDDGLKDKHILSSQEIDKEKRHLQAQNGQLLLELAHTASNLMNMKEKYRILQEHFSSLLATARHELDRKNNAISKLTKMNSSKLDVRSGIDSPRQEHSKMSETKRKSLKGHRVLHCNEAASLLSSPQKNNALLQPAHDVMMVRSNCHPSKLSCHYNGTKKLAAEKLIERSTLHKKSGYESKEYNKSQNVKDIHRCKDLREMLRKKKHCTQKTKYKQHNFEEINNFRRKDNIKPCDRYYHHDTARRCKEISLSVDKHQCFSSTDRHSHRSNDEDHSKHKKSRLPSDSSEKITDTTQTSIHEVRDGKAQCHQTSREKKVMKFEAKKFLGRKKSNSSKLQILRSSKSDDGAEVIDQRKSKQLSLKMKSLVKSKDCTKDQRTSSPSSANIVQNKSSSVSLNSLHKKSLLLAKRSKSSDESAMEASDRKSPHGKSVESRGFMDFYRNAPLQHLLHATKEALKKTDCQSVKVGSSRATWLASIKQCQERRRRNSMWAEQRKSVNQSKVPNIVTSSSQAWSMREDSLSRFLGGTLKVLTPLKCMDEHESSSATIDGLLYNCRKSLLHSPNQ